MKGEMITMKRNNKLLISVLSFSLLASLIIIDFKKETNILTGNEYYTINIDCLGLYFNVLVDPSMINYDDLEVGKVARGVFFNTVLLVADNHPDYF